MNTKTILTIIISLFFSFNISANDDYSMKNQNESWLNNDTESRSKRALDEGGGGGGDDPTITGQQGAPVPDSLIFIILLTGAYLIVSKRKLVSIPRER